MNIKAIVGCAAAALITSACATVTGPSVMVLPGSGMNFDQFQLDDAICRQFAAHQSGNPAHPPTHRAVSQAAIGTALGAAAGAAIGAAAGNPALGAAVGAGAGLLGGSAGGGNSAWGSSQT